MAEDKHLYLVDGSGYIFRAYHKLPPLTNPEGTPVGAVYGFTTMLLKLQQDLNDAEHPTHLAVIFDVARKSFRNDIYPDYKAHRPPPPEDLIPQFSLVRDATRALSLPCIELEGFEADDLIATYAVEARNAGFKVTIVSSDKDLMQLIGDGVDMLDTMKNRHLDAEAVREKFGVGPEKVIEVQALMGDSADNVPGVPGIGPKGAAELIRQYGDLETLLGRAEEIRQPKRRQNLIDFADQARVSKVLVTLKTDVPLPAPLEDFRICLPEPEGLIGFLDLHGFKSLKSKVAATFGIEEVKPDPAQAEIAVKDIQYDCVTDLSALKGWIDEIYKAGIVAVDTETTSLDPMEADLVGISLSVEAGKACYIPLRHKGSDGDGLQFGDGVPEQIPFEEAIAAVKPVLEDASILKVGQNLKYDFAVFAENGIRLQAMDDTMLMSYALECGLHNHGMDELSELHLGITPVPFKEVAGTGKKQITFDYVPLEKATHYAAEDADITGRLFRILKPRLIDDRLMTVYETLERPMVPILADMERAGIKLDKARLARLSNEFAEGIAALETEIHKLAGRPFNIGSPKQLGEVLFDEMGLKGSKKGKTGAYSTSVDVMENLAAEGHELPVKVLEWRQFSKLKSTYTDALQKQVNGRTGRVHTSYALASTSTGRLSSNDPNLQNIPIRTAEGRKIRKAFITEEGYRLLAADYSQIELRVLAHMAEIDALRDAFEQGLDIHAMTASQVFGVPMEGMDPMVRRKAKAINFGIIYGISAFGLANQIGVSRGEAKAYIDAYFERFPGIRDYMERTKSFCHDHGYVETIFGRRCHIRAINDKNPAHRAFGERAAINAPIQGSAADILRRAMIRIPGALKDAGLDQVRMLLQVHDELVFELPKGDIKKASGVIRETMVNAVKPAAELSVPLTVDIGTGLNWDEAH